MSSNEVSSSVKGVSEEYQLAQALLRQYSSKSTNDNLYVVTTEILKRCEKYYSEPVLHEVFKQCSTTDISTETLKYGLSVCAGFQSKFVIATFLNTFGEHIHLTTDVSSSKTDKTSKVPFNLFKDYTAHDLKWIIQRMLHEDNFVMLKELLTNASITEQLEKKSATFSTYDFVSFQQHAKSRECAQYLQSRCEDLDSLSIASRRNLSYDILRRTSSAGNVDLTRYVFSTLLPETLQQDPEYEQILKLALNGAAREGNLEVLREILTHLPALSQPDLFGACQFASPEVLKFFLSEAEVSSEFDTESFLLSIVHSYSSIRQLDSLQYLFEDSPFVESITPVHWTLGASMSVGSEEAFKYFFVDGPCTEICRAHSIRDTCYGAYEHASAIPFAELFNGIPLQRLVNESPEDPLIQQKVYETIATRLSTSDDEYDAVLQSLYTPGSHLLKSISLGLSHAEDDFTIFTSHEQKTRKSSRI